MAIYTTSPALTAEIQGHDRTSWVTMAGDIITPSWDRSTVFYGTPTELIAELGLTDARVSFDHDHAPRTVTGTLKTPHLGPVVLVLWPRRVH